MSKFIKKAISCILVTVILSVAILPLGASAVAYPTGVTSSQAEDAIGKTDRLITGLLEQLSDTTLKDMIMPELCSSNTLSLILVEVYKALEKNSDTISALGLNITVSQVAAYLSVYPQVSRRLLSYSSWSQVDLDGVEWGVSDERGFAVAVSAIFGPLNSLIYALVCGGTYPIIGSIVGITGEKGYENAILPIYESLGCTEYKSPAAFYSEAAADKHAIIRNIVLDLLAYIEKILSAPASMLTENLPSIAHFVNNGGLESAISALMEPMKISVMGIPLLSVDSFVDLSSIEGGMSINLDLGSISLSDFKTAPLDLDTFASCGTLSGNRVIPNKGDVYIEFLRWVLETVKLNQSFIIETLNSNVEFDAALDLNSTVTNLLAKPTDEIITILVNILSSQGASINDYQWSFRQKRESVATYTENLTYEDFESALNDVDTLVDDIVAETGEASDLRELLEPKIYSNSLLSEVVTEVYTMLQGEDIKKFVELLGVNFAPYAVAESLTEEQFSAVSSQLSNFSSWEYINKDLLDWGFTDGDKQGFIDAVSAVLRPADSLFRMLLAGGKISVLNAIDFYGSDGYNTAIIPILEAMGVYSEDILSYSEYLAAIQNGDAIKPVITSLASLIDRMLESPFNTVTEILPNLMYFLNYGGLGICAQNLIYPVMNILNQLGLSGLVDFSALTQVDVNALIAKLTEALDISFAFPELNLSQFEGMGELVTVDSKRTQSGSPIQIYAINADRPAVLVTLLRYAVETIKLPGNDSIIISLIDTGDAGTNSMISSFAQGISENISAMTVDETVEWVFSIFFSKRVTVEDIEDDGYIPQVSYTGGKKFPTGVVATVLLVIFMLVTIMILINRDKIKFFLEDLKINREKKN